MISFEDASLVIRKWRDESAPLDFFLAEKGWLMVTSRCFVADLAGFMIILENNPIVRVSLGVAGAEFRYEDRRAKLTFVQREINLSDAVCALRISFQHGPIALLVERRDDPNGAKN